MDKEVFTYKPIFTYDQDGNIHFFDKIFVEYGGDIIEIDPTVGVLRNGVPIGGGGGGGIATEVVSTNGPKSIKVNINDGLVVEDTASGRFSKINLDGLTMDQAGKIVIGNRALDYALLGNLTGVLGIPNRVTLQTGGRVTIGSQNLTEASINYLNNTVPTELLSVSTRIDALKNSLDPLNLPVEFPLLQNKVTALTGRTGVLEVDVADLKPRVTAVENRVTIIEPKVSTLETKVSALETGSTASGARITAVENRTTTLEGKVAVLEPKVTTLETGMASVTPKVTTLEGKVGVLEPKVATLETKVGVLEPKVTTLETDVSALKPRVTNLETKVGTLESDYATLEPRVTTLEPKVAVLETEVGTLSPVVASNTSRLGVVEPKVTALEGEVAALSPVVANNTLRLDTVEPKVTTLETKVSAIEPKVTTLEGKVSTLEPKVTTLEGKVSTLEPKVTTLQADVVNIKSVDENFETRITKLENAGGGGGPVVLPFYVKNTELDFGTGKTKLTDTALTLGTTAVVEADAVASKALNTKFNTFGEVAAAATSRVVYLDTADGKIKYNNVPYSAEAVPGYVEPTGINFGPDVTTLDVDGLFTSDPLLATTFASVTPSSIALGFGGATAELNFQDVTRLDAIANATDAATVPAGLSRVLMRSPAGVYQMVDKTALIPAYVGATGLDFGGGDIVNKINVANWRATGDYFSAFTVDPAISNTYNNVVYDPATGKLKRGDSTSKLYGSSFTSGTTVYGPTTIALGARTITLDPLVELSATRGSVAFNPNNKVLVYNTGTKVYSEAPQAPTWVTTNGPTFGNGTTLLDTGLTLGANTLTSANLATTLALVDKFTPFSTAADFTAGDMVTLYNTITQKFSNINTSSFQRIYNEANAIRIGLTNPTSFAPLIEATGITFAQGAGTAPAGSTRLTNADLIVGTAVSGTKLDATGLAFTGTGGTTSSLTRANFQDLQEFTNRVAFDNNTNKVTLLYDTVTKKYTTGVISGSTAVDFLVNGTNNSVSKANATTDGISVKNSSTNDETFVKPQSVITANAAGTNNFGFDLSGLTMRVGGITTAIPIAILQRINTLMNATPEFLGDDYSLSTPPTLYGRIGTTEKRYSMTNTFQWLKQNYIGTPDGAIKIDGSEILFKSTYLGLPSELSLAANRIGMKAGLNGSSVDLIQFSNLADLATNSTMVSGNYYFIARTRGSTPERHIYNQILKTLAYDSLKTNMIDLSVFTNPNALYNIFPAAGRLDNSGLQFGAQNGTLSSIYSNCAMTFGNFNNPADTNYASQFTSSKMQFNFSNIITMLDNAGLFLTDETNTNVSARLTGNKLVKLLRYIDNWTPDGNNMVTYNPTLPQVRSVVNSEYISMNYRDQSGAVLTKVGNMHSLTSGDIKLYLNEPINVYGTANVPINKNAFSDDGNPNYLAVLPDTFGTSILLDFSNYPAVVRAGISNANTLNPGFKSVGFIVPIPAGNTDVPYYEASLVINGARGSNVDGYGVTTTGLIKLTNVYKKNNVVYPECWLVRATITTNKFYPTSTNINYNGGVMFKYAGVLGGVNRPVE